MKLSELRPAKGSRKKRFKVGRGPGSGKGKTSGRGGKGQTARKSGGAGNAAFEGGQMPLQRRVPKVGFRSHFPEKAQVVNLKDLEKNFTGTVSSKDMADKGLIKYAKRDVKVLGDGKLTKALTVSATAFSASAKAAIEAAGGKVILTTPLLRVGRKAEVA